MRYAFSILMLLVTLSPLLARRAHYLEYEEIEQSEWYQIYATNNLDSARTLIEEHLEANPRELPTLTFYAELLRRLEEYSLADSVAAEVLELNENDGFAWGIRGSVRNPQYMGDEGDTLGFDNFGEALSYYLEAYERDESFGDIGEFLWIEGMRIDDTVIVNNGLERMYEAEHFTATMYSVARLYLRDVPENGILFTNGDMDTYPLVVLQHIEGYRDDVTVINTSLLNTSWYPIFLNTHENVDFGIDTSTLNAIDHELDYSGDEPQYIYRAAVIMDSMVSHWESGHSRPMSLVMTMVSAPERMQSNLELRGMSYSFTGVGTGSSLDGDNFEQLFENLDPTEYVEPYISGSEVAAIILPGRYERKFDINLYSVAFRAAREFQDNDEDNRALRVMEKMIAFFTVVENDKYLEIAQYDYEIIVQGTSLRKQNYYTR